MGFSINDSTANKRIRLIPKSTDAASDLYWSKGAVTEDNGGVGVCLAPRKETDTAFLIHVPVVYYKDENNRSTKAHPFTAIEINGVSYSLEGIPDLNGSNLRDEEWFVLLQPQLPNFFLNLRQILLHSTIIYSNL